MCWSGGVVGPHCVPQLGEVTNEDHCCGNLRRESALLAGACLAGLPKPVGWLNSLDSTTLTHCPLGVRGCGAAGSAPAWHAGGQGFESPQLHFLLCVVRRVLCRSKSPAGGRALLRWWAGAVRVEPWALVRAVRVLSQWPLAGSMVWLARSSPVVRWTTVTECPAHFYTDLIRDIGYWRSSMGELTNTVSGIEGAISGHSGLNESGLGVSPG